MSQVPGRQRREDGPRRGDRALEAKAASPEHAATRALPAAADLRPGTTSTCNAPGCTADVLLAITLGGKRIQLDSDPHPDGIVTIEHAPDGSIRARILTGRQLPAQGEVWMPHERTCTDSATAKRRAYATAPKCRACAGRMDPWLPAHGYRYHVNCEPPADLRERAEALREKSA
jgi:hypothetical protein